MNKKEHENGFQETLSYAPLSPNEGKAIRIISARKATRKESSFYPKGAS